VFYWFRVVGEVRGKLRWRGSGVGDIDVLMRAAFKSSSSGELGPPSGRCGHVIPSRLHAQLSETPHFALLRCFGVPGSIHGEIRVLNWGFAFLKVTSSLYLRTVPVEFVDKGELLPKVQ
jgi:hypothetical protein